MSERDDPSGAPTRYWERLNEIFHSVVALPPGERAGFLDNACPDD